MPSLRKNCLNLTMQIFDFSTIWVQFMYQLSSIVITSFDCINVYEKLDKINEEILELEKELKALHDQANIFEQEIMEFKQIKLARRELKLLKNLWDYINIITSNLDEWKTTFWKEIDVEGMEQECKKLIRELRRKFYINNCAFNNC